MTTLADITGYRRFEVGVTRTYLSALRDVTERIAGASPVRQRDILLRGFPELALPRVVAMQDFATTWAEDLYGEQSARIRTAHMALPETDVLEATVRWAIAPAFGEAAGTVFDNLSGAGQRYIADAGRSAIVGIEPRGRTSSSMRMRRFPEPGACDWCISTAEVTPGSHDHCHCVIAPVFGGDPL